MSTLQSLTSLVRDNIQDYTNQYVSDAQIANHLNDGQMKLSQMTYSYTSFPVSVPANTDSVSRPAGLLAPQKAFWRLNDVQWEIDISSGIPEDTETTTGTPDTAYFAAGLIYLRCVPDQAGTLTISGTTRPTSMVLTTDSPTVTDGDDVIVAYATWKCWGIIYANAKDKESLNSLQMWRDTYSQLRQEWAILDAQKNPTTNRIQRDWWTE